MQFKRLNKVNGEATEMERVCRAGPIVARLYHGIIGASARDGDKGPGLYIVHGTS